MSQPAVRNRTKTSGQLILNPQPYMVSAILGSRIPLRKITIIVSRIPNRPCTLASVLSLTSACHGTGCFMKDGRERQGFPGCERCTSECISAILYTTCIYIYVMCVCI